MSSLLPALIPSASASVTQTLAGAVALLAIGWFAGVFTARVRSRHPESWTFTEQPVGELFDSADVGFFVWQESGAIVEANEAFLRISGRTRRDLASGELDWKSLVSAEPRGDEAASNRSTARAVSLQRPDGEVIPVIAAMTTFDGIRHRGLGFVFDDSARAAAAEALHVAHDVLRQRVVALTRETTVDDPAAGDIPRLRASVEDLAARLAAANAELEAFAYSVSHDLRAPLRTIDGFSRELVETHGELLTGRAQHYLERIRAATQKMGSLIDALLDLSRISRAELHVQPVDLTAMARRVADDLRARGAAAKFVIEENVRAEGDPILLQLVFENLLGNAVKFSARVADPVVEFGTSRADGGEVFHVRDNGAGFDPRYASKLFTPFQRLHPMSQFDGTGIGLAIVNRIVTRHGGRVWAQSAQGEGATFYFTISPRKDHLWTPSSS